MAVEDNDVEARIARLESDVAHIRSDMAEVKSDIRTLRDRIDALDLRLSAKIDALKDENTVILAAAAADRRSFGCSDDSELTYFGEAFYQDSLPSAVSLREAFDFASGMIETRENAEGLKHSNPQAFFGEKIEARLAALEPHAAP